jgi:protein-L-isoaspartate(D-aspartate) O-methyltransferase
VDRVGLIETLYGEIRDERVLAAMAEVPRQAFVPPDLRDRAWENVPLPIGCGQTISQPFVVARMCELLDPDPDGTVLDVGTGSGYHAAVLSKLAARVVSIERHAALSRAAADSLAEAGIDNVELVVGDGTLGCPEYAPYDAINVAAACEDGVPEALASQLADGGRLVAPVGRFGQRLMLYRREDGELRSMKGEPVRFVPLVEGSPPADEGSTTEVDL